MNTCNLIGLCENRNAESTTKNLPDPFPCERVGSGDETNFDYMHNLTCMASLYHAPYDLLMVSPILTYHPCLLVYLHKFALHILVEVYINVLCATYYRFLYCCLGEYVYFLIFLL